MLLKRRHEFKGFIFSVPVNITCCSDGSNETGKVMFMNDCFKRFDISFESNFTLFEDFQDDERYHKSSYKYNDRTLNFIRQQKSKIGFFRFDIPNKSGEIQGDAESRRDIIPYALFFALQNEALGISLIEIFLGFLSQTQKFNKVFLRKNEKRAVFGEKNSLKTALK